MNDPTPTASSSSTGSPIAFPSSTSSSTRSSGRRSRMATKLCSSMAAGSTAARAAFLANAGEDVHVVGSVAPLIDGYVGCIEIKPDGSRVLARVMPDPLAQQKPD
jgi:hypothetical protein